jgi:nucleotide-binding universal stress UspA family protein
VYQRILVPIDLNESTSWERALPPAIDLARTHRARLHLLSVIPDFGMPMVGQYFPPDFEAKAREESRKRLEEVARQAIPEGLAFEAHVAEGNIYREILALAESLPADLIVMASHRPGLQDYLIGPNAARVVRHAQCSVMVIR